MNRKLTMNIPIARTSLLESEIASVLEPLRSGWLVQGPKVKDFEEKWCKFTGAKHSIAVTSCTTGLHLSLTALGLQPNDEVIVPAFTWISTANVVEHLQAKVVFCDIDLKTFNLDIQKLEGLVTSRTKAIIPVHLFGMPAEINKITTFAKKYKLWVIEDAACGFGSRYQGQHVGTFGNAGVFSFHPRKAITTGEGGMITTQDEDLASKLRCLRDHGATTSDLQRHLGARPYLLADHTEAGFNQRMTDLQAALGSTQMDRSNKIIKERQSLAKRYSKAFANILWLQTPIEHNSYEHGFQSYPCLFKPEALNQKNIKNNNKKRNEWMDKLQQLGISTRPATHAVHMLSFYQKKYNLKPQDFPNAYLANECSISLPLFNGMKKFEQDYVIQRVLESSF